jgi:metal-sulfur cluster biosynthetic enzyme
MDPEIDTNIDRDDGLAAVRHIAESVPDPELVVVTVGDLGIIRDLRRDGASVEIDVTPTYSACPATLAIELAIETAVAVSGGCWRRPGRPTGSPRLAGQS